MSAPWLLGENNLFLHSLSRKATLLDASNNHPATTENMFCPSTRAGSTAVNSPMGFRPTSPRAPSPAFISHGWSSAEARGLPECRTAFCLQLLEGHPKGGPHSAPCLTAPIMPASPPPPPTAHSPLGNSNHQLRPTPQLGNSGQHPTDAAILKPWGSEGWLLLRKKAWGPLNYI